MYHARIILLVLAAAIVSCGGEEAAPTWDTANTNSQCRAAIPDEGIEGQWVCTVDGDLDETCLDAVPHQFRFGLPETGYDAWALVACPAAGADSSGTVMIVGGPEVGCGIDIGSVVSPASFGFSFYCDQVTSSVLICETFSGIGISCTRP